MPKAWLKFYGLHALPKDASMRKRWLEFVGFHVCTSNVSLVFNDWWPSQSTPPDKMRKYIVYEDCLLQLFERCNIENTSKGTPCIMQTCPRCQHSYKWNREDT